MTIDELASQLTERFGPSDRGSLAVQAPGRVNLIGEHTDYNDGFVLPMAIDRHTTIVCRRRDDQTVRLRSVLANEGTEFSIATTVSKDGPKWSQYARGIAEALRARGLLAHGIDAVVDSTVPLGGGLSSSASFENAVGLALLTANGKELDLQELALASQWAEHHYAGMPCGIMDQFISAMGRKGHALLLDCRDRSTTQIPFDDPALRVVIANSNVKHELVQGEYAQRRKQCEMAVAGLQKRYPEIRSLRDATMEMLDACRGALESVVYRRGRHVIGEIARTTAFAERLRNRDYAACGKLMYESHDSLRDDYEVSCRELDLLVEIASASAGVHGARMTGGGFGGCIVALTTAAGAVELERRIGEQYPKKSGRQATVFSTVPSQGAHVVKEAGRGAGTV
jgi:galactokinase